MEYSDVPKTKLSSFKAAMFGLAGASYASLMKVTEIQSHDTALTVAFFAFAIAIPLLIALAITTEILDDPRYTHWSAVGFGIFLLLNAGSWAFVLGFAAFLWHYSIPVALIFFASACVGLIAFIVFQADLAKASESPKSSG